MTNPLERKVLYVGSYEGFQSCLNVFGCDAKVIHVEATQEALSAQLKEADALIDASMKVNITNEMILAAKHLKVISCATTGSNHIERSALENRNIPILTLKEAPEILANITPAAELSWALLMACSRKLTAAVKHVNEGGWIREDFPGIMLNGKRLGLIGCGRIGGWMARYARAFGMEVIGFDPLITHFPETINSATIQDIFLNSDFISIHVHLSVETEKLISAELLSLTKPGVIIINTSRGQIIDEVALLQGLMSGHIGAAGLDVVTSEPNIENDPLVKYASTHDNLLITPHCGGFSPDAVRLVCKFAAERVKDMIQKNE